MPIEHRLSHSNSVRFVRMSGNIHPEEFDSYGRDLATDSQASHRVTFVDLSSIEFWDIQFEDVLRHADSISDAAKRRPKDFTEVILAPTDLTFGVARMYETVANGRFKVLIFRDEDAAHQKLHELISDIPDLENEKTLN